MFVHGFGDKLWALNAATGDFLWEYSRALPKGAQPSVKRNIALYGDKVYMIGRPTYARWLTSPAGIDRKQHRDIIPNYRRTKR